MTPRPVLEMTTLALGTDAPAGSLTSPEIPATPPADCAKTFSGSNMAQNASKNVRNLSIPIVYFISSVLICDGLYPLKSIPCNPHNPNLEKRASRMDTRQLPLITCKRPQDSLHGFPLRCNRVTVL